MGNLTHRSRIDLPAFWITTPCLSPSVIAFSLTLETRKMFNVMKTGERRETIILNEKKRVFSLFVFGKIEFIEATIQTVYALTFA